MNKLEIAISIATRHCPKTEEVAPWFQKKGSKFIIAQERGESGHKHLQCALQLSSEIRPNTLKSSLITYLKKIYEFDKIEEKNIRVLVNTNPKDYHFAYCTKEKKYHVFDGDTIYDTDEQYEKLWEKYKSIKEAYVEKKKKFKDKEEEIMESFQQYCHDNDIIHPEDYIKLYLEKVINTIPFKKRLKWFTRRSLADICEIVRLSNGLPYRSDFNIEFGNKSIPEKNC